MLTEGARKIAEEAKRKSMWIYSPSYKKWYSPEDFMHIFHFVEAKEDFLKQLQIRHPNEGIEAGFQRLAEVQSKLKAFMVLVFEYYKK